MATDYKYLNKDQRRAVNSEPNGHTFIKGCAGSGKSTIAIHRASNLARYNSEDANSVLLLAFNKTLTSTFKLQLMDIDKQMIDEDRIDIKTIDSLIYWLYKKINNSKKIDDVIENKVFLNAIRQTAKEYPDVSLINKENSKFLKDEVEWIIANNYIDDKVYADVDRIGRGSNDSTSRLKKNSETRKAISCLTKKFIEGLERNNYITFGLKDLEVLKALKEKRIVPKTYKHIIIDEVQDFTFVKMQIIKYLYDDTEEDSSVLFLGDLAQSIYTTSWMNHGKSFKSVGFDMSGRSKILDKNYRNTYEIANIANNLIKDDNSIISNSEYIKPELLDNHGEKPMLVKVDKNEERLIKEIITKAEEDGYSLKDIAILMRTKRPLISLENWLKKNGIASTYIKNGTSDSELNSDTVKLYTFHSVKGLEFPVVIIAGLNNSLFPLIGDNVEDDGKEEKLSQERRLFYVTMTRAKERLYLMASKDNPSVFINDIDRDCYQLKGEEFPDYYSLVSSNYRFLDKLESKNINFYNPEEAVRQWMIDVFIKEYNIPENMIDIEYKIQKFSSVGFADIVVYKEDNGEKIPVLIAEVKAFGKINDNSIVQLKQYASCLDSVKYVLLSDGKITEQYKKFDEKWIKTLIPKYQDM